MVENRITELLEDRLSGLQGIKTMTSRSLDGRSSITLEFQLTRDIDNAANDVRDRVSRVLNSLPDETVARMQQLGGRNLERSVALNVPIGQCVARRLGVTRLSSAELLQGASAVETQQLQANNQRLLKKTPLWYYILKEAEVRENGLRLGTVGARIIIEVFARMLHEDADSFIHHGFTPSLPRHNGLPAGDFTMVDLLSFAQVLS